MFFIAALYPYTTMGITVLKNTKKFAKPTKSIKIITVRQKLNQTLTGRTFADIYIHIYKYIDR